MIGDIIEIERARRSVPALDTGTDDPAVAGNRAAQIRSPGTPVEAHADNGGLIDWLRRMFS